MAWEREVEIAADWWTRRLEGGVETNIRTGDRQLDVILKLNAGLQSEGSSPGAAHPIRSELFRKALSARLYAILEAQGRADFGVDYDPERPLMEALLEAGIDEYTGVLPTKSMMWICAGSVSVKEGYGAPIQTLLGEPERESG